MNQERFEQEIARRPLRRMPAEWREEILQSVKTKIAGAPSQPSAQSGPVPWWRAWLWPSHTAWTGVAAIWLLAFGFHLASKDESGKTMSSAQKISPDAVAAFLQNREETVEPIRADQSGTPTLQPSKPTTWQPTGNSSAEIYAMRNHSIPRLFQWNKLNVYHFGPGEKIKTWVNFSVLFPSSLILLPWGEGDSN